MALDKIPKLPFPTFVALLFVTNAGQYMSNPLKLTPLTKSPCPLCQHD